MTINEAMVVFSIYFLFMLSLILWKGVWEDIKKETTDKQIQKSTEKLEK